MAQVEPGSSTDLDRITTEVRAAVAAVNMQVHESRYEPVAVEIESQVRTLRRITGPDLGDDLIREPHPAGPEYIVGGHDLAAR